VDFLKRMSIEHGQDFNGAKVVKKRGGRTVGLGLEVN
jgi:hypothetical protein